jgi:transposase-like protein
VARWDRHTKEFKARAVERMKGCANIKALATELQVSRQMLYQWKYEAEGKPAKKRPKPPPAPNSPAYGELKKENVDLKIALADKTLQADFFRGALQRVEDGRRKRENSGGSGSTTTSPR